MTHVRTLTAGALLALGTAMPAAAQVSFSFGADIVSNYISRGATQTNNGAAFQPWAELEYMGLYAGLWASNVNNGTDNLEVDIYGGYRWGFGGGTLDIGYALYTYDNSPSSGELYLLGEIEAGRASFFGGLYFATAGAFTLADAHLGVTAPIYDALSVTLKVGDAAGTTYGDISLGYAFSDNVSASLGVNSSSTEGTRILGGLHFSF